MEDNGKVDVGTRGHLMVLNFWRIRLVKTSRRVETSGVFTNTEPEALERRIVDTHATRYDPAFARINERQTLLLRHNSPLCDPIDVNKAHRSYPGSTL